MKTLRLFLAFVLLAISQSAGAQVTTAQIREEIAKGECETAQSLYNVYKAMNGTNKTIELEIADCLSAIRTKNEAAENLNKAREYISKGECDNAQWYYSQYKKTLNASDYELERQIDDCHSQKKAEEDAAQKNLEGVAYYNSGNFKQAANCFWQAANQGNMSAQYNLGQMYEAGLGVDKNIKAAKIWYQRAANQGHGDAQNRLNELNQKRYEVGESISIDGKPYYVAYVDYTGQHGWAFWPRPFAENRHYSRDCTESTPTIDELRTIYDIRYRANCSVSGWRTAEYWSSSYVDGKFYTLDFSTGKTKTRKKTDRHCHIFIKEF